MKFIKLENFRVFKNSQLLKFQPITFLIGPNSSGKSSVIRIIEILKGLLGNSLYNSDTKIITLSKIVEFELQKIIGSLGDFSKVLSVNSDSYVLKIGIPLDYKYISRDCELQLSYELNKNKRNNSALLTSLSIYENNRKTYIFQLVFEEERWITKFINFPFLKEKYLNDLSLLNDPSIYKVSEDNSDPDNFFYKIKQLQSGVFDEGSRRDGNPLSNIIFFDDQTIKLISRNIGSNGTEFYLGTQTLFSLLDNKELHPKKYPAFSEILSKNNIFSREELRKRIQYEEEILLQHFPIKNFNPHEEFEEEETTIDDQINLYNRDLPRLLQILVKKFWNKKKLLKSLGLDYSIVLEISNADGNLLIGDWDYKKKLAMSNRDKASMLQVLSKVYFYHFLGLSLFDLSKKLNNTDIIKTQRSSGFRSFRYADPDTEFQKVILGIFNSTILSTRYYTDFIKRSFQLFEIGDAVIIQQDSEGENVYVYIEKDGSKFLLTDLGFGINQLAPLIISTVYRASQSSDYKFSKDGFSESLITVEEPEANLHPAFQSKLADFFIDAYNTFNIKFIIETHSEYLIRKLQYLTAKGIVKATDTVIYYFNHPDQIPEGERQVVKINIENDGGLSKNFGKGFYDEASNLDLMLYQHYRENKN